MKYLKATKKYTVFCISILLAFFISVAFLYFTNMFSVVALAEEKIITIKTESGANTLKQEDVNNVESLTKAMFDNSQIESSEYMYNLDGSSDYIYVNFVNGGYAVYYKETLELLEYSADGVLNYPNFNTKKYYAGPGKYLIKQNDTFMNTLTGEALDITIGSALEYSSNVREMLNSSIENQEIEVSTNFDYSSISERNDSSIVGNMSDLYNMELLSVYDEINMVGGVDSDIPVYDRDKLIRVIDGTYIPNYNYFLSSPLHGMNQTGTCGAVATQLLLSYNNYYNDRRIIADRYLNGGENESEKSPNLCSNPMLMNTFTLGTRGYYEDGRDDENSYFGYLVNKIPASANTTQITNGLNSVLSERNSEISGTIDYTITSSRVINSNSIVTEIDSGIPVIILMQESLGGTDHYVVAYGYQNYTYPNSTDSYLGYITHFGWKSTGSVNYLNIWVNSSWCHTYFSLDINHTHNYTIDTGNNIDGQYRELKCGECGHRTVDALYSTNSSGKITGFKYSNVPNGIVVPTQINNTNISSISSNAFRDCTSLQSVTFASSSQLTSIGYKRFLWLQ